MKKIVFSGKLNANNETLINNIRKDKKKDDDKIDFILLSKIGEAIIKKINHTMLEDILNDMP